MLSKLTKFSDILNTVYTYAAVVFLTYCIFATTVQVVARYVFNSSPSWTEETARYTFIWTNILGATIAVKHKTSAAVDFLQGFLPGKIKVIQGFVIRFLMLYCAIIMITEGVKFVDSTIGQKSAAAQIPMQFVAVSIPLCGFGVFVHVLVEVLENINVLRRKKVQEVQ